MKEIKILWEGTDWLSNSDIVEFMKNFFSKQLLDSLILSTIQTDNRVFLVANWFRDPEFKIYTKEQFQKKLNKEKNKQKLLDNVAAWVTDWETITIFNQDFVSELYALLSWKSIIEAEIEYFEWVPLKNIPKLYKLWVLPHEIGHSIHDDIIIWTKEEKKREKLSQEEWPTTMYVKECYPEKDEIYYSENFAEALRIFATNPTYLKHKFPKIYKFIEKTLIN